MPTGTGKTVVLASVINDYLKEAEHEGNQVLIVAHRIEIINQIREMIKKFNLVNELEEGRIRVESIHRLARKTDLKKLFPCEKGKTFIPTLCIIDEAHHAQARSYKKLWKWWENAKFLGMTATPCRLKILAELLVFRQRGDFLNRIRLDVPSAYHILRKTEQPAFVVVACAWTYLSVEIYPVKK